MNKIKLFIAALFIVLVLFVSNAIAIEKQKIGLVDFQKILSSYDKAAAAQNELEANQKQLENMLLNAQKELKNAKNEQAKEQLQKQFAEKIMNQNNAFRDKFSKNWESIQNNVLATIKQVADREGYTLIMDKQSVVAGGEDITDKVLKELK